MNQQSKSCIHHLQKYQKPELTMKTLLESDLYFVNASTVTNRPAPGKRLPAHFSLVFMLDGQCTYSSDSSTNSWNVQKGDLYCQFANTKRTLAGTYYHYMFVSFNGKKAKELLLSIGCTPSTPLLKNAPKHIYTLMHEIMKAMPTRRTENPYFFLSRISAIAEAVWEINYSRPKPRKKTYSKLITQALEQMEYRCPGVTELAKRMDVNPDTLSKACLRETGMPAKDFLINLRIQRAKALLRTTPYKIEYIALACGYSNDKHFYKSFRQHTGSTPARWRKTQTEL